MGPAEVVHSDEGVRRMRHPLIPVVVFGAVSALELISAIVTDSVMHRVLGLIASAALFGVCVLRVRSFRK